eukprot:TRINITY_DN54742_c0_g1_i1.p1 TRINITY_DN54742_c0_g1~~TRINITY_DN54742_c0_g1_i1.p1  ORF type:complete len:234 (+),score=43.37 TRINITY_DN54742_c0_g1_i1:74-775(+)
MDYTQNESLMVTLEHLEGTRRDAFELDPNRVIAALQEHPEAVMALDAEQGLLRCLVSDTCRCDDLTSESWRKTQRLAVSLLVELGAKLDGVLERVLSYYWTAGTGMHRSKCTPLLEDLVTSVSEAGRGNDLLSSITAEEFEGVLRLADNSALEKFRVLGLRASQWPLMSRLEECAARCDELGFADNSRDLRAALQRLRCWQRCDAAAAKLLRATLAVRLPEFASRAIASFAMA